MEIIEVGALYSKLCQPSEGCYESVESDSIVLCCINLVLELNMMVKVRWDSVVKTPITLCLLYLDNKDSLKTGLNFLVAHREVSLLQSKCECGNQLLSNIYFFN